MQVAFEGKNLVLLHRLGICLARMMGVNARFLQHGAKWSLNQRYRWRSRYFNAARGSTYYVILPPSSNMDTQSTINLDARRGRIVHIGGDQLNLNIQFSRTSSAAPSLSPSVMPSIISSYFSGVCNYMFSIFSRRYDPLVGLSKCSL